MLVPEARAMKLVTEFLSLNISASHAPEQMYKTFVSYLGEKFKGERDQPILEMAALEYKSAQLINSGSEPIQTGVGKSFYINPQFVVVKTKLNLLELWYRTRALSERTPEVKAGDLSSIALVKRTKGISISEVSEAELRVVSKIRKGNVEVSRPVLKALRSKGLIVIKKTKR